MEGVLKIQADARTLFKTKAGLCAKKPQIDGNFRKTGSGFTKIIGLFKILAMRARFMPRQGINLLVRIMSLKKQSANDQGNRAIS